MADGQATVAMDEGGDTGLVQKSGVARGAEALQAAASF
jgi:hypothetical protein